jgi:hypothetical protein
MILLVVPSGLEKSTSNPLQGAGVNFRLEAHQVLRLVYITLLVCCDSIAT